MEMPHQALWFLSCQVLETFGETADVKVSWHQRIGLKDFPMGKESASFHFIFTKNIGSIKLSVN